MKKHVKIREDEKCSLRNVFTPFLNGFFPPHSFPENFCHRSRVIWWIAALSSWRHYLYHRHCYATVLYHTNSMTSLVEHSGFFDGGKGQLISNANCQVKDSSKKQMKEFIFTSVRRVFVCFMEESTARKKNFSRLSDL